MREVVKKTDEQKQIDRLYDTLKAYQLSRRPLELTDTEIDLLMHALITRAGAIDIVKRFEDDGR